MIDLANLPQTTGSSEKVPAKFGEGSSVWADGLCIGCLGRSVGSSKEGKFKHAGFFFARPCIEE